jgi:hypothetical protein
MPSKVERRASSLQPRFSGFSATVKRQTIAILHSDFVFTSIDVALEVAANLLVKGLETT